MKAFTVITEFLFLALSIQAATVVVTGGTAAAPVALLVGEVVAGTAGATAAAGTAVGVASAAVGSAAAGIATGSTIAAAGGSATCVAIGTVTSAAPGIVAGVITNLGLAGAAAGPVGWALLGATTVVGGLMVGAYEEEATGEVSMNCWRSYVDPADVDSDLDDEGIAMAEKNGLPFEMFERACDAIIHKGDRIVARMKNGKQTKLMVTFLSDGSVLGLHCNEDKECKLISY